MPGVLVSRSVILKRVFPNQGTALTLGQGTDIVTGETIQFAGTVATMLNLATLLEQFANNPRGDQPVINVTDEFIVDIDPEGET